MVEFALVLPVLLLIVLGIIEAALVIQGYLAVQHAAREAARFASTYQPPQGACMDLDGDGVLQDGFNDAVDGDQRDILLAQARDPDGDGYPYCPSKGAAQPHADADETEAEYLARRVELIKMRALEAARGLRVRRQAFAPEAFANHRDEAGFFGVSVWGFPSFQTKCSDYRPWGPVESPSSANPCLDHPGIQGGTVRVYVRHNVEILDPLYGQFVQFVPVQAEVQAVNEGVQVGFGDIPPPHFETDPSFDESDDDDSSYLVLLTPTDATNILPDDYSEVFDVVVTQGGSPVAGETVSFRTDFGSFSAGGAYVEVTTDASGEASVTLESSSSGRASLRAWVGDNGDNVWNGEPTDSAICRWVQPGHSITLLPDHAENVLPEQRAHELRAVVEDENGSPVRGVTIAFLTDAGGFSYSGDGPKRASVRTDSAGQASITLYGNYSETATIEAWMDNGNGTWETSERKDTATKTWLALDPYITVSDYEVYAEDLIYAGVHEHPARTHDLWWCSTGTSVDTDTFVGEVDGTETGIAFTVPEGSSGSYVFETHDGGGGCGDEGDLVAQSALVEVVVARPDLEVEILDPGDICPRSPFKLSAIISNTSAGPAEDRFEVDFYIDRGYETGGTLAKQWIDGLDAGMSKRITTTAWVDVTPREHTIEAYVDPRRSVDEVSEYNNSDWLGKEAGSVVTEPIKINFQEETASTPAGYLADTGQAYGDRGNGYSYGWDSENLEGRDRGVDSDQRYDTLNHMAKSSDRTWEIALPESEYEVQLVMGDPAHTDQINTVTIEGVLKEDPDGEDHFDEYVATVTVSDGKLTIAPASDHGSSNAKVCFIHITDLQGGECGDVEPEPPPWGEGVCKPPGSKVCRQLLKGGDFEDDGVMLEAWDWVDSVPWPRSHGDGVQSIVLQASQGWPPSCRVYAPELAQTMTIPDLTGACTETVSTTLVVRGHYLVDASQTGCSIENTVDADDELYLELGGVSRLISNGSMSQTAAISGPGVASAASLLRLEGEPSSGGGEAGKGSPRRCQSCAWPGFESALLGRSRSRKGLLAPAETTPGATQSLASEMIHATSFDADWGGWSHSNNGGSIERTGEDDPHSGSYHVRAVGEDYDNPPTLVRDISTEGFENVQITYWKKDQGLESDEDDFEVLWYDGAQWHTLEVDAPVGNTWTQRTFDLSGTAAEDNAAFRLRFNFRGDYGDDEFFVDDIQVSGDLIAVPAATVDFSSPDFFAFESAGTATITATLSEAASEPIVVAYRASNGTATAPDDYARVEDTLTFPAGETVQTFPISIVDDTMSEDAETVLLTLDDKPLDWVESFQDQSPGAHQDDGDTAWWVTSGDGTFEVSGDQSFEVSNTGGEREWWSEELDISDVGAVDVSVRVWSEGDSNLEESGDNRDWLNVYYVLDGGSEQAIATFDGAIGGTQTVGQDGLSGDTLQIVIRANTTASDEYYYWDDVSMTAEGGGSVAGPNNPALLTIVDDDSGQGPVVDFTSSEYVVDEGAGQAVITAAVSLPLTETVTVAYQTVEGSATVGEDYEPVSGTLTFGPKAGLTTFTVPILDDDLREGNESLKLELFDAVGVEIGSNNPATLSIAEDEDFTANDWHAFSVDLSGAVDIASLVGDQATLTFFGAPDADRRGTWFYLDDLECEICTTYPVPEQEMDKGTIGGTLTVDGWPEAGVSVWAYNEGTGVTYQTVTLGSEDNFPEGTYHFYNIPPGDYMVYSELWESGWLYWDTRRTEVLAQGQVTVDLELR